MGRISEDKRKKIAELWDRRIPAEDIAADLGVSKPSVLKYGFYARMENTKRTPRRYPPTEEKIACIRRLWNIGYEIRDIVAELGINRETAKRYAYKTRNGDGRPPRIRQRTAQKTPGIRKMKPKTGARQLNVTCFTEDENEFLRRIASHRESVEWRVLGYDDYERVFIDMHGIEKDDGAQRRYMGSTGNNGAFLRVTERYRLLKKAYGI